jgi:hypothetical protein
VQSEGEIPQPIQVVDQSLSGNSQRQLSARGILWSVRWDRRTKEREEEERAPEISVVTTLRWFYFFLLSCAHKEVLTKAYSRHFEVATKLFAEVLVTVFMILWRSQRQELDCLLAALPSSLSLARQQRIVSQIAP